ncbi:type IV secretory pathway TrbD component [Rheinheimera pacifica]|uniref:VirB3 family type IV secretion system protein n=1 Tax=Rheinheimera pacifica TaxID=173990 RepID=UPI002169301C|nr:VirB3 family type IV secretion system protein [Rheinheimera pacifica]MCS4309496.1 type IV secretory pathway TrbD component [Rheinheimera pacifica]
MAPEGWEVPVNQAITKPDLLGGVPRKVAVLLGVLGLNFLVVLKQWWMIPIIVVLWIIFAIATKKDPEFFSVIPRHFEEPDYLEP